MKKLIALLLVLSVVFAFAACGGKTETEPTDPANPTDAATEAGTEKADDGEVAVMSHEEYAAAAVDTKVCVETYVQAKQSWWENKATVYAQSEDGAYFLYNMSCSEDDYALLTPGTKIKVTGFKSEWAGEVEIVDATFEILEGSFIAEPVDVTALLGTDELASHMNEYVSFKGMTVEASTDETATRPRSFIPTTVPAKKEATCISKYRSTARPIPLRLNLISPAPIPTFIRP